MLLLKYYAVVMTLSQRNNFFKGGIILSSLCCLFITVYTPRLFPLYGELTGEAVRRVPGMLQDLAARFFEPASLAAFATMTAAAVYALGASILIYFFFEKTQSPEILFVGLFSNSFVFETLRIMVPLKAFYDFPVVVLILGARILLFGRFFGVLALFGASVYAAGLTLQKQGSILFAITIGTLLISLGVPIDGLAWDTSLTMISGYASVFTLAEAGIMAITVISFLVAAYTRGSKEYLFAALGVLLVALGRSLLITADTWVLPIAGFLMLNAGTGLIALKLHQVYLWL